MTIYALSSGAGISGIAVIRISGKETSRVIKLLAGKNLPKPRVATLRKINKVNTSELIDEAVILWFPGPESYTGEDMAEIQVHGSKAVVDALFNIAKANGCYKIALQCRAHNVEFYEKCGYEVSGIALQKFIE